ncbi:hypothetical protein R6Q59_027104 [Mikania micrantha]
MEKSGTTPYKMGKRPKPELKQTNVKRTRLGCPFLLVRLQKKKKKKRTNRLPSPAHPLHPASSPAGHLVSSHSRQHSGVTTTDQGQGLPLHDRNTSWHRWITFILFVFQAPELGFSHKTHWDDLLSGGTAAPSTMTYVKELSGQICLIRCDKIEITVDDPMKIMS